MKLKLFIKLKCLINQYSDYKRLGDNLENIELIKLCLNDYRSNLSKFQKMEDYYNGNSDAMKNYKLITSRTNSKTPVNFIKKFVKEETSYILGFKITYISKSGDENIIKAISDNFAHWSEKHDQNLCKNALKFGTAFEVYYIDKDGLFSSRVLNPLNAYVYELEDGSVQLLLYIFTKKFDKKKYLDVYYSDRVEHYCLGENNITFDKIGEDSLKIDFGEVPVSVCYIAEEKELDTLFNDLKGLCDAYETNLSDITNEISDWRNAYLKFTGCDIDDADLPKMKELGAIKLPSKDSSVDWLIKNINDTFIQNTLSTLEDKIYQISAHINSNEKLQSNTSSLALRTRLISLENKCKLNSDAIADCIKSRLKFLFKYLAIKQGIRLDYRDIKIKFTPMIPSDDLMMAQILSQAGDKISTETGISQFSFIDNPKEELEKIQAERESMGVGSLDNLGSDTGE